MKISAILPYFGGKRTMAPLIVRQLGTSFKQYFDPFCGSMAVLFGMESRGSETVNDLHGDLINLAIVLQSYNAVDLYDRCMRTLVCEHLLEKAEAELATPINGGAQDPVVVSTYDCPRYRELYAGWTFIDCARMKNLLQQNGRGKRAKEAPEVLIVNGPEYT